MNLASIFFAIENNYSIEEKQKEFNAYLPGKCNIGKKEIEKRKWLALSGLLIVIASVYILQVYSFSYQWRALIFFPLSYSILCFLQAKNKFCVLFGLTGVFNFNDIRKLTSIKEIDYHQKDRRKSLIIIFTSIFVALVITMIYLNLPF